MRHIRPSIDHDDAIRSFEAGWISLVKRQLPSNRSKEQPFAERIWLPTYVVTIRTTSLLGDTKVSCSVDAYSGSFAFFQMHDSVEIGEVDEDVFEALLKPEEAESIARQQLLQTILRRRGRDGKPTPQETLDTELMLYPYWVYYHRRRDFIDISVLDAATGQKTGLKIKMGILEAFKRAERHAAATTHAAS